MKAVSIRDKVLLALETYGPLTVGQVATATGLKNPQVSGALTPLRQQGIVNNTDGEWSIANKPEDVFDEVVPRVPANSMKFEAIGFNSEHVMLVRDVSNHAVYSITPV